MPSIQNPPYPLVFKVPDGVSSPPMIDHEGESIGIRVHVRAFEGMQKEALVAISTESGDYSWRMVCDEGPYLNGTDLAPFPLAFYTAGMQFSFLSELLRHAKAQGVTLDSVFMAQDNYYTMQGSALRGTMIGGAKPVDIKLKLESNASPETIAELIRCAEQSSPAQAVMQEVLSNTFALTFNGQPLAVSEVHASDTTIEDDLQATFSQVQPDEQAEYREGIISKLSAAKVQFGVEGGAGSSLKATQRRTLHIHGEAEVINGMLMETTVQLYKPIGSTFHFVCDETPDAGGNASAPPPLAYLSAGVGFCYMTQLGRYAHITKQNMESYQIIQDNLFTIDGSFEDGSRTAHALPFDTHVHYQADEPDSVAQKTLSMGERTCFLHAAMRGTFRSEIEAELNGEALAIG